MEVGTLLAILRNERTHGPTDEFLLILTCHLLACLLTLPRSTRLLQPTSSFLKWEYAEVVIVFSGKLEVSGPVVRPLHPRL